MNEVVKTETLLELLIGKPVGRFTLYEKYSDEVDRRINDTGYLAQDLIENLGAIVEEAQRPTWAPEEMSASNLSEAKSQLTAIAEEVAWYVDTEELEKMLEDVKESRK